MFRTLRQDLERARRLNHKGMTGVLSWIHTVFHCGTTSVIVYRFGHWAHRLRVPVLREVMLLLYAPFGYLCRSLIGVNIPIRAEIGPGLVVHTWNGVYLPACRIGRNAFFQHGVVVAYRCRGIGDDVYFGPGAKVIREVFIADRARIGANAVVLADVPADTTVAGVPARPVRRGESEPI